MSPATLDAEALTELECTIDDACREWVGRGGSIDGSGAIDTPFCRCPFGAAIGDRVGFAHPIPEDAATEMGIPKEFASAFMATFDGDRRYRKGLRGQASAMAGRFIERLKAGEYAPNTSPTPGGDCRKDEG